MARRAGTQTVAFSLDGVRYQIDLPPSGAEELRTVLAPFIAAGRRQRDARPAARTGQ